MASAASTTFVQNLYQTVLFRSGSANDVNSWATLLDSGLLTQSQEISAFEQSSEATGFTDVVVRMYETFFHRAPDEAGLSAWVNALRNGTVSVLQVAQGFVGSQEFANDFGTTPNATAFVTALYQNVLGRAPDAPGLAGWVNAINSGTSLASVALGFANSTEFINDASGAINTWLTTAVNAVNAGTPVAQAFPAVLVTTPINTGTYVLPTTVVSATATNFFASETYFTTDGKGPTLLPGDSLTGAGSNNTLTVTDLTAGAVTDNIPAGVTLSNIQNVILNSSGNTAASGFSTVGVSGVKNLTVTTAGGAGDVVAAASGANGATITVNHDAFTGGGVTVLGGTTINVATNGTGGTVLVGLVAAGTVPAPANLASGGITVSTNSTGGGNIDIVGGTSVSVTATSPSYTGAINIGNAPTNTANSASGASANTTGAITVSNAGIGGTGATVIYGGSTVGVTASGGTGAITVGDSTAKILSNEATGAITVSDQAAITYNGQAGPGNNNLVGGAINVFGGTTVSVTSNDAGSITVGAPGAPTASAALPTGAVTVVNTGLSLNGVASSVTVDGGTNISIANAGGSVTVGGLPVGAFSLNPTGTVGITETAPTLYNNFGAISSDGGTAITVTALGQNVTIGANGSPTGAVTVSEAGILTGAGAGGGHGAIIVDGGTNIGITTTGGSVTVGTPATNNLGAPGLPSGSVTITDTFSGANGANSDAFAVVGGTTVSITTTATGGAVTVGQAPVANATGTGLVNTIYEPTGNVTINDSETNAGVVSYGTGATNVYTNGASTVSITGGVVGTVTDVEATVLGGKAVGTSNLSTVTLDGSVGGATTVVSNALATLTVIDNAAGGGVVTVTDITPAHTIALVVGNDKSLTFKDAGAGTISVSDNGKVSSIGANVLTIAGAAATTINFANSAALSVPVNGITAPGLTTITDTGAGSLSLGDLNGSQGVNDGLNALTKINASGASGAVSAEINPVGTSFIGGSGADVLTIDENTTLSVAGSLNGGSSGHNTIVANYAATAGVDVALGGNSAITNFQTFGFGAAATSGGGLNAYDVTGFSSLLVTSAGTAGDLLITNASSGGSLTIAGNAFAANAGNPGGNIVYDLHAYGASNAMSLTIGTDGPTNVGSKSTAATIVATDIQNLTVTSQGAIAAANANTVTFGDTLASSITVAGDQVLSLTLDTDALGALHSSGSSVGAINASGSSGAVTVSGVSVSASGATITGGSGYLTADGALGDAGEINNNTKGGVADGASVAQVNTLTINTDTNGDTIALTVNGTTVKITATGNIDNDAATLAGKAFAGFILANPGAPSGTVTITDNTAGVLFSSSVTVTSKAGGTTASDTTTTAFANEVLSAAVDTITTGSGGGNVTIGAGGSWNPNLATPAYDTGSETINLTASAAVSDTLTALDGATSTFNGTKGGVTGFGVTPSIATADQFFFGLNNTTAEAKTVLANNGTSTAVSATDAVGQLVPILLGKGASLANLTWTSSNGVITFGATGGNNVSQFTSAQLIAAAEVIVDEQAGAGANTVAAFVNGGNTYVVSAGASGTVTKGLNDNSVVELIGVTGITGFGTTAGQGTIVDGTTGNLNLISAGNTGSVKGSTNNDAGFAADSLTAGKSGVTNTYSNLAPSAVLTVNGGGNDLGNLVTTQTGAAGANTLTVSLLNGDTLDSASFAGDNTLILASVGSTITSLVDPGNTLAAIAIAAGGVTIGSITDSALVSITGAAADAGNIILGSVSALSQAGLSITLSGGGNDQVTASGAADHITTGAGGSTITASGTGDVITVGNGGNTITAAGANDTITLGTGHNVVVAIGTGDVITVNSTSATANDLTVGSNAIVTTAAGESDLIRVTGDVAGTVASFGFTTIKGAHAGTQIFLNELGGNALGTNLVGNEYWLGNEATNGTFAAGSAASTSEVNVAGAASVTAAVNIAAAQAAAKNVTGAAPGTIAANVGVLDWFQFGGNTYIVEATNTTGAPAPHTALGSGDVVIELVGLITPTTGANNIGANTFGGHTLIL